MTPNVSLTLSGFPWLILAAGLAGCGASTVREAGATGTGGSASATATSSSGMGGGVPAAPPCQHLVQTGNLVGLEALPNTLSLQPKLRSLGDGQMAIVYTIAVPGMGPQKTISSNIVWTTTWPPPAAMPVELVDRPWYKSSVVPSAPKSLALLGPSKNNPSGMAFGFADALNGGFSELVLTDPKALYPAFVAAGDDGQFFAGVAVNAGIPANNVAVPHVGWVATKGATSYVGPIDLGCPIDPVTADAVATPGGWILARAVFDKGCFGSAAKVRVTRFTGGQPLPSIEINSGPWSEVALLPRPGGAWLLYSAPPSGFSAARIDSLGHLELGPIMISGSQIPDPLLLAADALDAGLVAILSDGGSPTTLAVVVTDENGKTISSVPLYDMSGATAPQIAFDPTTRQVLVALVLPDASPLNRIHVARFSCK